MAAERDDNNLKSLADRLRGKMGQEVRQLGKELSGHIVGKVEAVKENGPPRVTPKVAKSQDEAGWQRQLSEEQKQKLAAKSLGKSAELPSPGVVQKNISQTELNPVMG